MRILESQRLILKPAEEADLDFLLALRWDAEIMEYLIHDPISARSQRDWLDRAAKSSDIPLTIFVKEGMQRAGTLGLYNINARHQRATWRLRLHSDFQGKGIAYEAVNLLLDYGFNTLNLNKIVSDSFCDNVAIVNLSKKLGFSEEGRVRNHYFHKGKFRDAFNFGLLRDEFNAKLLLK